MKTKEEEKLEVEKSISILLTNFARKYEVKDMDILIDIFTINNLPIQSVMVEIELK